MIGHFVRFGLFACMLAATAGLCEAGTLSVVPTANIPKTLIGLPPDPGAAGMATLEGIDADGDGVWDDVQRWIAMTYPDSEKTRAALIQRTKAMQQFILNSTDSFAIHNIAFQMGKDRSCLAYVQPNQYYQIAMEQKAIFLNTTARDRAWLQTDHLLSGSMFSGLSYKERKKGCSFDPDLMPN